jgi:hypothetical protein
LIAVEGTKTPVGNSGNAETPQTRSGEEAQRRPAESEVPGTEINSSINDKKTIDKTQPSFKFPSVKKAARWLLFV